MTSKRAPRELTPEDREEIDALVEAATAVMQRRSFLRGAAITVAWSIPLIETFITAESSTIRNWAAERTARARHFTAAS